MVRPGSAVESGLSPLARGTLISEDTGGDFRRFIPAGAGNTAKRRRV
ncbi:hypothetical protein EC5411_03061 [Escherichia coli 541-1]|nr:hypothetical protein EC5411_03061 [Escherichia coli 541-1]